MNYRIIKLNEQPELLNTAAEWFHLRWNHPVEAYRESMEDSLRDGAVIPAWYLCLDGERIIAGLGVIVNDFHERKDLFPNVCAVYTDQEYRGQGIAGALLQHVCQDMQAKGIDTLYLVTDHVGFYEKYGWEFLCMVQPAGKSQPTRMYVHRAVQKP